MGLQHPPNPGLCPARGPGPRRGAGAAARPQTLDGTRTPWHGGLPSGGGVGGKHGGGGVCVGERIYRPPPRPLPGRARGPGDAAPWGPWPVGSERGGADSGGAAPGGGGAAGAALAPALRRGGSGLCGAAAPHPRSVAKGCADGRFVEARPPGKQQATAAFPPTPVPLALGGGQWESCGPASSPPPHPRSPPAQHRPRAEIAPVGTGVSGRLSSPLRSTGPHS